MSKKYKAVIYMRISCADDTDKESQSLTNQRKQIEEFLKNNPDIELVSEKLDDGYTGLLFDRPSFKEMMEEIYDGKVNTVITRDLSRFGREYIETGNYLRNIFPKHGVRFIAISDGIDTKNDMDLGSEINVTLKTLLNDAYCRDISKKTRTALMTKRKNGEFIGACPVYGYLRSSEEKNKLVIDPYASEIVKEIFSMKKDGFGANKIADVLNKKAVLSPLAYKRDRGLPVPSGGFADKNNSLWSATTIIRMLKDATYTGTLIQGKQTTYSYKLKNIKLKPKEDWVYTYNAHEPIISQEDFDLVAKLMNLDTRTSPDKDSLHLFSGILICECCGNRMTRKTVPYKDKKYFYYYCPTGKKNGCTNKMMKENDIIECVFVSIKSYVENVINLDDLLDEIGEKQLNSNLNNKYIAQLDNVKKQIKDIGLYKSNLYENLLNEVITKSEYNDMKKQYNTELEKLKNAKNLLSIEFENMKVSSIDKLRFTKHFKTLKDMTSLTRRTVVQLIKSITIGEDIYINFRYKSEFENVQSLLSQSVKEGI